MEKQAFENQDFYLFSEFFSAPTFLLDGPDQLIGSNAVGRAELERGTVPALDQDGHLQ
ncbi:MAG: hypothetical protein K9H25_18885 [Rhodospirillum sp.]|nr:hypothetical protein [Rhodospirillum sp.]